MAPSQDLPDPVFIERLRSGAGRFEKIDSNVAHDGKTVDPAPPPDEAFAEHESLHWMRRMAVELRKSVAGTGYCIQVLDCVHEGLEDAAEVAEKIGCRVEDVHQAHRTLKLHGRRIRIEFEKAEARRMAAVRAKADVGETP